MSTEEEGLRVAELESELEQVRAELERIREKEEAAAGRRRWALGFGGRFLVGKELRKNFRAWLEAKSLRDPLPADETAGVLAAIVRRVVRVGFVGAVLAAIPTALTGGFLLWQNLLINRQVNQQASDTLIVRRAQLLATIYEEDCEDVLIEAAVEPASEVPEGAEGGDSVEKRPPETKEVCQPRAHPRARQEAVIAFCKIEHSRGAWPDLSGTDFLGLNFSLGDLSRANLGRVNLGEAFLVGANLSWTNLSLANLSGANLVGANLSEANLSGAYLNGAYLFGANLDGANLDGANLSGANLVSAKFKGRGPFPVALYKASNLKQEQIDTAYGDGKTQLPPGLKRPAHWEAPTSDVSLDHPPQSQSPEPSNP